jgi:hydroxylamine reductase
MNTQTSTVLGEETYAMLCRQCEQTANHKGCTNLGICGKTPETSAAQDGLIEVIKSVSAWCVAARAAGLGASELKDANAWTLSAAFSTLTNVNFSERRIAEYIHQGMHIRNDLEQIARNKGGLTPSEAVASLSISQHDDLEHRSLI